MATPYDPPEPEKAAEEEDDGIDPLELWQRDMAAALQMIARTHMPFGKYGPQNCPPHGVPLYDVPVEYLLWFRQKGFPKSKLGRLMEIVCSIKVDGSEAVFEPFRRAAGGRAALRPPRKKVYEFPGD